MRVKIKYCQLISNVYIFWKVWISSLRTWKIYFNMMFGLRGVFWNVTGENESLFVELLSLNLFAKLHFKGTFARGIIFSGRIPQIVGNTSWASDFPFQKKQFSVSKKVKFRFNSVSLLAMLNSMKSQYIERKKKRRKRAQLARWTEEKGHY